MSFSTTYMALTLPSVGIDTGPNYATLVNSAFTAVDAHNHSQSASGNGRPIDQTGIVLTGDLAIGGFNLTNAKSLRMPDNGGTFSSSVLGTVYRNGADLYYNDGSGTAIRITASGAVNTGGTGNISGMDATSAVTYSTVNKTYTFTQSAGFPAKLISGDIQIFETVAAAAQALTLKVPAGFAAGYTLTLPAALPATPALFQSSAAGVMSFVAAPGVSTALLQSTTGGALSFVTTLPSGLTIPSPSFGPNDGGLAPTGAIIMYGGAVAPTGWLIGDGSAVSRTVQAPLFAVIGTTYGIGDGSTTFTLPPKGYFPRAWDNQAGNDPDAAARVAIVAGTWTLASCTKTNGQPTIGVTALDNFAPGMTITGTGIPANTVVRSKSAATGAGTITMGNAANTANVNATDGTTITATMSKSPTGAYMGSLQADVVGPHTHSMPGTVAGLAAGSAIIAAGSGSFNTTALPDTNAPDSGNSSETRPRNVYFNFIIRT